MLVLSTARLFSLNLPLRCRLVSPTYCKLQQLHYTLHVRSRGKQFVLFSSSPNVSFDFVSGNIRTSRENKTNWFPEGPDIKCFVIFLDFHFKSNKRITGVNQNCRLGTYNNTNLTRDTMANTRVFGLLTFYCVLTLINCFLLKYFYQVDHTTWCDG